MSVNNPPTETNTKDEPFLTFVGRIIGILIFSPFAFAAFCLGWGTISCIGIIIFVGFPCSAIFLDTIRWVVTNYNDPKPNPDYLASRLKKAAKIFINIFQTMADLKEETPLFSEAELKKAKELFSETDPKQTDPKLKKTAEIV